METELSMEPLMNSNSYLKLFFAESGMQIDKIFMERE